MVMPTQWLFKKLARLVVVLLSVSALTFLLLNVLPGDVAHVIGGADASAEDIAAIRADLGLDRSLPERYISWLGSVLGGNLGKSYLTGQPVLEAICARLPVTIELLILSQILALAMALPAGMIAAYRNGTALDRLINAAGFATLSIPSFVMALLFVTVFSIHLRWLPATGYAPLSEGLGANLTALLLPALSIALIEWVVLMRVLRSDMITTLQQNYILMARAKGLPPWKVLLHHAFRPSSFTMVTICGLQVGRLLGEAVIVETIFALPGVGRLLLQAISTRDYLMVQGCVLLISAGYVTINAVIDMAYPLIDPRIRTGQAHGLTAPSPR
ncbi:MAG: ABC transporter permease [Pseudomonadota bacterium]